MQLPSDYIEHVYAGVLGKIIGVYLGRPFEGWNYRDLVKRFGEVKYYVHEELKKPLIVADDDITGTFTFIRALEDHASGKAITSEQIGQTWMNYIIENKTILWWGGMGMSTEHTAFLRMKHGTPAPRSGSIELNGQVVAEQIGAQIFIDGWAMVAPGQPDLAADLAGKAGRVSHDGEAVYAAQLLAAMEAQAFVERDLNKLFDVGLSFIPRDCLIAKMIADLRAFHAKEPDWNKAMTDVLERHYGYDKYGGNCHTIPNHGVIVLALLYGGGDFDRSLMIANTCGWDTDCNSGNVGCLLGIRNGLAAINANQDWRGPVADRVYLPTADGGSCIGDAVRETYRMANIGYRLAGQLPVSPKNGARFHFSLPGSVQGFRVDSDSAQLSNEGGRLAIRCDKASQPIRVGTPTFMPTDLPADGGYSILASPSLSPGQRVTAAVSATAEATVRLFVRYYGEHDAPTIVHNEPKTLTAGREVELAWTIPSVGGQPIFEVGLEIVANSPATVLLDWLTWSGTPNVTLGVPKPTGWMWKRQWVDAVDRFDHLGRARPGQAYGLIQNFGRGLVIYGTRDWTDYTVSTKLSPHMAQACGVAARVQGLRRYYALVLANNAGRRVARLIKVNDRETTLSETPFDWTWSSQTEYDLRLTVQGDRLIAAIDGKTLFDVRDSANPIKSGNIALLVDDGRVGFGPVTIAPVAG